MADKFEFDLGTIKAFESGSEQLDDLGFRGLNSCVPKVTIGANALAAIRAGYFSGSGSNIGPQPDLIDNHPADAGF